MAIILFCLIMSVSALADTYVLDCFAVARWGKLAAILLRPLLLGAVYLVFLPRLPREPVSLSPRLWKLVLGLAAMPLCSLAAVVLLTGGRYDSAAVLRLSSTMGLVVLPVVLLTSAALLAAILVLAQHEALEQSRRLASLREIYYQGLQQQERQVRQLRHDLRNHLTALLGLLEREDVEAAKSYAAQLSRQDALQGTTCFCDNEIANVVLSAKSAELERAGIPAEFSVSLPAALPVADTDLCALLGNAMDNAREGGPGLPVPLGTSALPGGKRVMDAPGGKFRFRTGAGGPFHHQVRQSRPRLRSARYGRNRPALRRHPGSRLSEGRVPSAGLRAGGSAVPIMPGPSLVEIFQNCHLLERTWKD